MQLVLQPLNFLTHALFDSRGERKLWTCRPTTTEENRPRAATRLRIPGAPSTRSTAVCVEPAELPDLTRCHFEQAAEADGVSHTLVVERTMQKDRKRRVPCLIGCDTDGHELDVPFPCPAVKGTRGKRDDDVATLYRQCLLVSARLPQLRRSAAFGLLARAPPRVSTCLASVGLAAPAIFLQHGS